MSRRSRPVRRGQRRQRGSFLLEALIGVLIFAFGVLGIVGLQSLAMRVTNESQYRAEAAYLANTYLAQMWGDDYTTLATVYGSGGTAYTAFATKVKNALGAVWVEDPDVAFDAAKAPSAQSSFVTITIPYRMPGEPDGKTDPVHQYVTSGVVGQNP
jgi:type IV pilus assembly protein PilV